MNEHVAIAKPDTRFRRGDEALEQLIINRRTEVEAIQKEEAEAQKEIETSGQQSLYAMMEQMDGGLKNLIKQDDDIRTPSEDDPVRQKLINSMPSEVDLNEDPGNSIFTAVPSAFAGWVTPYYATIHGSDGQVDWQGYNPGNLNVWTRATGAGSGIAGTGAGSFHAYVDWWFKFRPDTSRYYSHSIYVPFNGFYIARADDKWYNSKRARVSIGLSARGYQYNWKGTASTNRLSIDDDNVNVNRRFDGWQNFNYSSLLAADQAYLRVSLDLYVYARGGGSLAELNFATGDANKLGVPVVYVS